MSKPEARVPLLDYLRFFAAMSVVCFHYLYNGIANGKLSSLDHVPAAAYAIYGYFGVDLFFIISGYVICLSASRRTAGEFVVGRAVRLYPAYFVAVLLTSCVAYFLGGARMGVTLRQVLGNLVLFQPLHGQEFVDGVYWTLMYEIYFYALVALILGIGAQKYLSSFFRLWPFIVLLAMYFGVSQYKFLGGYYVLFGAGALLAMLGKKFTWSAMLGVLISWGLAVEFAIGRVEENPLYSKVVIACIISAFFLAFYFVEKSKRWRFEFPASRLLGGLTYPLYLIHAHIGYMLLSTYATPQNQWLAYGSVFSIIIVASYAIHRGIEVQLASLWRWIFQRLVSAPSASVRYILPIIQKRFGG